MIDFIMGLNNKYITSSRFSVSPRLEMTHITKKVPNFLYYTMDIFLIVLKLFDKLTP
jgi:hypothetical protein